MLWPYLILWGILLSASILDYRHRWIPNFLTVPLALAGLTWGIASAGWTGLWDSLKGLAFLFGLFALARELKLAPGITIARGGDVKLAAGVGAWLGFTGAYYFLMAWVVCNAIGWLVASRKAYVSWRAWWDEQRVSLEGLTVAQFHSTGAVSYPGALTITAAAIAAAAWPFLKGGV